MNEINTGGPAFPGFKLTSAHGNMTSAQGSEYTPIGGMSLRDYFAAKAMQGILAGNSTKVHEIAQASYIVADVMLKERMK